MKKIRLVYPQWQGAYISGWIPNIPEEDSSRGYYHLLVSLIWRTPRLKENEPENWKIPKLLIELIKFKIVTNLYRQ